MSLSRLAVSLVAHPKLVIAQRWQVFLAVDAVAWRPDLNRLSIGWNDPDLMANISPSLHVPRDGFNFIVMIVVLLLPVHPLTPLTVVNIIPTISSFFSPLFPTLSPIEWRPTWEEKVCRQYVKLSKLCVPPIVQPFVPSPSILVRPALLFNFPRQPLDSVDSLFRAKWIICRWTMNCWKKWLGPSPANETFLIAGSTDGAQPKVFLLPPPPIFLINL